MITRKHYKKIAEVIREEADAMGGNIGGYAAVTSLALTLADVFAEDNPRFDKQRFMKACGWITITNEKSP